MKRSNQSGNESYVHDAGTNRLLAALRASPEVGAAPTDTQHDDFNHVISPRLHRGITRLTDHPNVAFSLQRQGVHHGKRSRGGL